MSKISKEGYEQIQVIKNALDSIHSKLDSRTFYVKNNNKKVKDIEKLYTEENVFETVQQEFQAIAGIVETSGTWEEVE